MSVVQTSKNALSTLPVVNKLLRLKAVHGKEIGHFLGQFRTSEEALRSAPASQRSSWDDDALVENGIGTFSSIHSFDWPVMFFLRKLIEERSLNRVTDFGGHIGVKYLAYRNLLEFPEHLVWQVVETPAVVREGLRRATPELAALRFFEAIERTEPSDVLICSGSIQYTGKTVAQLVAEMPNRPRTILLNKVPVSKKMGYFTVERYIKSLAYRIYGPDELENDRNALGYTLAAHWDMPHRDICVMHNRRLEQVSMIGEAWTLAH